MISFDEALRTILSECSCLGGERVPLDSAAGRWLAIDVVARWDLPPYDNSAMDGYAVRAADTRGASRDTPACLAIHARQHAGHEPIPNAVLAPGGAIYVSTGAKIPDGADAVVRQEATAALGAELRVHVGVEVGENIRRRGEDAPAGRRLLRAGERVDVPAIAVLATFGHQEVDVARRPRVVILGTGDELVSPARAAPDRITDSNSYMAAALARELGAEVRRLGTAGDLREDVTARLAAGLDWADVVVTLGGSSVGERDVTRAAFTALGASVKFWKVAIKPGKPVGFATHQGKLLFALPGNPAAAAMTFELLVAPALLSLQGAPQRPPVTVLGHLAAPLRKQPGLTYFLRSRVEATGSGFRVTIPPRQGAGQVTPALGANGIAELPAGRGAFAAGEPVTVRVTGPLQGLPVPPVVCFVGSSGAGKTTLLTKVIARLSQRGVRIGALKHDAHEFQMDREGKDTWRFAQAGARAVGIASRTARAVLAHTDQPTSLHELVATLPAGLDLVLVEGYKEDHAPKIEVHRRGMELLHETRGLTHVVAVASDDPAVSTPGARLGLDDVEAVCDFLCRSWVRDAPPP